jgi:hypothetical protein
MLQPTLVIHRPQSNHHKLGQEKGGSGENKTCNNEIDVVMTPLAKAFEY